MFTDTVDDKYPQLVPTNNWQEIEPWQSVPHGCEISMNIRTGNRYVRLNPIIGSTPAQMDTKNCDIRNQSTNKRQFPEAMNVKSVSKLSSQPHTFQSTEKPNDQNSQTFKSKLPKKQKVNQKNSSATHEGSEVKKSQLGSYKEELQKCENCKRNFADLVKHRESKTCIWENKKHNVSEEDLNNVQNICKGCQKEFKQIIHIQS